MFCVLCQRQQGGRSWGDCVSTSRLGERGTPRLAHEAAVNCKRERERRSDIEWWPVAHQALCWALCASSHVKSTTNLWGLCTINLITGGKNQDLILKSTYSSQLGFELESDCEAHILSSLPYAQTYRIVSTTSQSLFLASIKPFTLQAVLIAFLYIHQVLLL